MIDLFPKILHLYSVIGRNPKDYGTGDLLYFTGLHTIAIGHCRRTYYINFASQAGDSGYVQASDTTIEII